MESEREARNKRIGIIEKPFSEVRVGDILIDPHHRVWHVESTNHDSGTGKSTISVCRSGCITGGIVRIVPVFPSNDTAKVADPEGSRAVAQRAEEALSDAVLLWPEPA